jgi:hypothetical protein
MTSVLQSEGFLGQTPGEMLSNRVCEITHEPLIEFGFAQRFSLRRSAGSHASISGTQMRNRVRR